ncbi:MAG: hypothetical protein HY824_04885 [Acidobacteria bacterium]|nr:hypothetical protein [Acidobacteriota bacterium]
MATVVALVVLFIRQLRPRTLVDAAATMVAVAVLVGHAGFRDNLENLPLNQMMFVMILTLVVWHLLEREWRRWHGPAIIALLLIAVGFKEQGLLIAPLVVAAWWMGAPGAGRWVAAVTVGVAALYLTMRLLNTGSWAVFPQRVGVGFTTLSPEDAMERFGAFLPLIYAYSVGSTVANVLFSEPTAGVFSVVRHISEGRPAPWEINQLLSSVALTGLVSWWGLRSLRRDADGRWSRASRLAIAMVIALAGSAALSFSYTRDRMGGVAVVFYALASFHALRAAAGYASQLSRTKLMAASLGLMLLAGAWQIRAIGTIEIARETASSHRREWIISLQRRRLDFADRPVYLRILETMVEQGTDPSAAHRTQYPRWVVRLLGEQDEQQ